MKTNIVKIRMVNQKERRTAAPRLYTDGTLLEAMEAVGKKLVNKQDSEILKDTGIGTPATRAGIIETLIDRGYVIRRPRNLIPTEKGRMVYEMVKDMKISDVAMTAQWELALEKIQTGDMDEKNFYREIEHYTAELAGELLSLRDRWQAMPELQCPKCKVNSLTWSDNLVKCSEVSCGWVQFWNVCGFHLGQQDIVNLLVEGSTGLLEGLKSKSGKLFNARLVLSDGYKVIFDFNSRKK